MGEKQMGIWTKRLQTTVLATAILFASVVMVVPKSTQALGLSLLNGQKQYYTVMMRADKQSLVYAKVTFENSSTEEDLKKFSFTFPDDVKAENVSVQQILAKNVTKSCKTYETYDQYKSRISWSYEQTQYYYDQNKRCLEYDEASVYDENFDFDNNMSGSTDYYYYDYYLSRSTDSTFEYKDLEFKVDGQNYSVELPNPVKAKKQGAILVSYTSKSYISGTLGRYNYDFRSFTAKELVSKVVVAINFDDDIYSTLTSSKRQVSTSSTNDTLNNSLAEGANSSYQSKTVDDIQTEIGRGGRYVKEKTQLLPGETLSVKGVFSTSKIMLVLPRILWSVAAIIVVGAAAFFGFRWYRRKHPRIAKSEASLDSENTNMNKDMYDLMVDKKTASLENLGTKKAILLSLASIAITVIVILAIVGLGSLLGDDISSNALASMMVIAGLAISCSTLYVLPLVYVFRFGARNMLRWSVIHTIVMILTFVAIMCVIVIVGTVADNGSYDKIDYLNMVKPETQELL